MRRRKFIVSISLVVIVALSVWGSAMNMEVEAAQVAKSSSSELTPHEPIYINGNSNFTAENGVSNPGAAGTASDPYIIENWDINASTAEGILIESTNVHFIIRNCVIHDGGSSYNGIWFVIITNGKINNVTSYNNYMGISILSSSNNNLTNCAVYNNYYYGIELYYSLNNQITNCNVYNNSVDGIHLYSSLNNTVTNCTIYNNSNHGIYLYESSNNDLTNCTIYNNSVEGINLSSSSNNYITYCTVYANKYAITLGSSSNTEIHYCDIYNNTLYGVDNHDTEEKYRANATYCWWGFASGPYHPTTNPNGTGDNVSDNVEFDPWLTEPWTANNPPNPPSLTSPDNDTWTNDSTPLFDWTFSDPDGEASGGFNVSIDDDINFGSINYYVNQSTTTNVTQWQFPENTSYSTISDGIWYWRVKANDTNGAWCDWSSYFVLKIDTVAPYSCDPIYINDNSDFTFANGVSSGSGTEDEPYIIRNWDINASNAHGIHIENTNVYFVIRNCVIHDGKSKFNDGIHFYNVTNGKIENCEIYNVYYGIYQEYCSNSPATNCNIYNCYCGIKVVGGGGVENHVPVVNSITANPATVNTGETVTVSVDATDEDSGDVLTYVYSCTGGTISGMGSSVTWTAPDIVGNYTITVYVNDGTVNSNSKSVTITVTSIIINVSLTNFTIANLSWFNISYVVNITNAIIINISYINITDLMNISNVSFANVFEINLTNFTYMSSCSFINVFYINITQSMNINNLTFNNVSYVYLQNVTNVNFVIIAIPNITTIAYEDLQMAIPAGALILSMPFNLSILSVPLPPGYDVVGSIYRIECGVSISAPINITLSYAGIVLPPNVSDDDLAIYKKVGDEWIKIDSTIDKLNNTVSALVTSFSEFAILYKLPEVKIEPTGIWPVVNIYLIVAVIITILIIIVAVMIRKRKVATAELKKPEVAFPPTQIPTLTLRCPQCKSTFQVGSKEKPFPVKCPSCGTEGMIK